MTVLDTKFHACPDTHGDRLRPRGNRVIDDATKESIVAGLMLRPTPDAKTTNSEYWGRRVVESCEGRVAHHSVSRLSAPGHGRTLTHHSQDL
jgi:hypothetical protein